LCPRTLCIIYIVWFDPIWDWAHDLQKFERAR
jgi:hypothetical protein